MGRIRVLVVEDSVTVRKHLCEILSADPEFEVAGEAADGKEAVALCQSLRPNVITMDMMLPVMSGLSATEYIMAHFPTPILVVSASINRGELFKTYEALSAGAVDVLEKPRGDQSDSTWEENFRSTVKLVSRIPVITHPRARLASYRASAEAITTKEGLGEGSKELVVLGASTGGPSAIVEILRALPAPFPVPILFVLHINKPFGQAFADWLDGQTKHPVSYARDNQLLKGLDGQVIMAPPDRHLLVHKGRLRLSSDPERNFCRPSVDVLFESIAKDCAEVSVACLLTGMGRDGAAGLLHIRRAGGVTLAQDEESSVVYGMPREAARLGAACSTLPLHRIAPALVTIFEGNTGQAR